jgi:Glu-tRNA(Gln) amidotransferase subunit E-like FAD-binding protein
MKFELYSTVILSKNLPQYGFTIGDVATVVDYIENQDVDGYILEFFDTSQNTIAVIPVLESDIIKPYEHAIVNYRKLAETA